MRAKLMAAVVAECEGEKVNVSEVCRQQGVSRTTFYKWVDRYRQEGMAGLEDRSTRPHSSPNQISASVEDRVVRQRKELDDAGLDHGATTVHWHLSRAGDVVVPSVATIHRVLVRRGLVTPQPKKRPKSSWCRFEASAPNECWQIDATEWPTKTCVAKIFNVLDDHSRVATRSRAVEEATTEEAWETFDQAATIWGMPAGSLSDNGLCFSGKLRGFEVLFETKLRAAGVRPITGRPYHPQTTGKVERFQQTLKKWLSKQPLAEDLAGLQAQLDEFCEIYNNQRPHQGIGRVTPISRWEATARTGPANSPIAEPAHRRRVHHNTVAAGGVVGADKFRIHIGVEYERRPATIIIDGDHATVLIDNQVVRYLHLDRRRLYQPSGRPRGGPRRTRLPS